MSHILIYNWIHCFKLIVALINRLSARHILSLIDSSLREEDLTLFKDTLVVPHRFISHPLKHQFVTYHCTVTPIPLCIN